MLTEYQTIQLITKQEFSSEESMGIQKDIENDFGQEVVVNQTEVKSLVWLTIAVESGDEAAADQIAETLASLYKDKQIIAVRTATVIKINI